MNNQSDENGRAFWALVARGAPDRCWEWKGKQGWYGYGRVGRNVRAHRLAYQLTHGPIQPGMVVRHRAGCSPLCCNPAHLQLRTRTQVGQEMAQRGSFKPRPNPEIWKLRHADGGIAPEVKTEILRRYKPGVKGCGAKALAKELGVHYTTVWRVANGISSRQRKPGL